MIRIVPSCFICIWLETLQDSIEVLEIPTATEVIVVRTNIWQLDAAVKRNLYVRSGLVAHIAGAIHQLLSRKSDDSNTEELDCPLELRSVLVKGAFRTL